MIRPAGLAFSFMSRFPVPFPQAATPEEWGEAVLWFPVVGLAIGLVLACLVALLTTGPVVTAALLVTVWVWATGGLHVDGLADTADAWIGGLGDRQRMLAIMKDPACGPAGVLAIVLLVLVKWSCLVELITAGSPPWLLLLPPLAGRCAILVMILTTPYARQTGLGSPLWLHLPRSSAKAVLVVASLPLALFWPTLPTLALLLWLWRRALLHRLGGSTGDTAGATCELTELATLLIFLNY